MKDSPFKKGRERGSLHHRTPSPTTPNAANEANNGLSRWDKFVAWYQDNKDSKLFRLGKFFFCLGVAYFTSLLASWIWFDHSVWFASPGWDFWAKTVVIFCAAAGLLYVLDSAVQSKGNTTALALFLFLGIHIAQHYTQNYYDADGNFKAFTNQDKGYIYSRDYVEDIATIKVSNDGLEYFIHPVNADTCWNEPLLDSQDKVIYHVRSTPYVFNLKAGGKTHWIAIDPTELIHYEVTSSDPNFDYIMVFDDGTKVRGASPSEVDLGHRDHATFYIKANKAQTISLMLYRQ